MVPDVPFQHAEGNSAAHFKAMLTGSSLSIPVQNGEPCLGMWQDIYFCEFDGPRARRQYYVTVTAALPHRAG